MNIFATYNCYGLNTDIALVRSRCTHHQAHQQESRIQFSMRSVLEFLLIILVFQLILINTMDMVGYDALSFTKFIKMHREKFNIDSKWDIDGLNDHESISLNSNFLIIVTNVLKGLNENEWNFLLFMIFDFVVLFCLFAFSIHQIYFFNEMLRFKLDWAEDMIFYYRIGFFISLFAMCILLFIIAQLLYDAHISHLSQISQML